MIWVLGWLYLRRADRVFDPLGEAAAERALERAESHRPVGTATTRHRRADARLR